MISSYPGAQNREEARRLEDQHRGEHRRLPDKATPRSTLRSTKDKDGTTTSDRVEGSQTRSKSKKPTRTDSLEKWSPQLRKHKGLKKQYWARILIRKERLSGERTWIQIKDPTRSTRARTSGQQTIDTRLKLRIGYKPTSTIGLIRLKDNLTDSNQSNLETSWTTLDIDFTFAGMAIC